MNRFDIVEAYYCYFVLYHGGQYSVDYRRMCNMQRYYRPSSFGGDKPERLTEGAREIFDSLMERNGHEPYQTETEE